MDSSILRYLERMLLFYQTALLTFQSLLNEMNDPRLSQYNLTVRERKSGQKEYRLFRKVCAQPDSDGKPPGRKYFPVSGSKHEFRKSLQFHYYLESSTYMNLF